MNHHAWDFGLSAFGNFRKASRLARESGRITLRVGEQEYVVDGREGSERKLFAEYQHANYPDITATTDLVRQKSSNDYFGMVQLAAGHIADNVECLTTQTNAAMIEDLKKIASAKPELLEGLLEVWSESHNRVIATIGKGPYAPQAEAAPSGELLPNR